MSEDAEDMMPIQGIGLYPYPIATWPLAGSENAPKDIEIINVRGGDDPDMGSDMKSKLRELGDNNLRSFPPSLLWHNREPTQSEAMATTEQYLLAEHVDDIAMSLLPGTILIELDVESPSKTKTLLDGIESHHRIIDYYALGMDRHGLGEILKALEPSRFNYVRCHGLLGNYENVRTWVAKYENKQRPVSVLSWRSTISSMSREETISFWKKWSDLLTVNNKFNSNNARIILGVDCSSDGRNDGHGGQEPLARQSTRYYIDRANTQLRYTAFDPSMWTAEGEWNETEKSFTQYLVPQEDVAIDDIQLKAGEKIGVAYHHRYDDEQRDRLFRESKLKELKRYISDDGPWACPVYSHPAWTASELATAEAQLYANPYSFPLIRLHIETLVNGFELRIPRTVLIMHLAKDLICLATKIVTDDAVAGTIHPSSNAGLPRNLATRAEPQADAQLLYYANTGLLEIPMDPS